VATSARLREFSPVRTGSPYQEFVTPLTYGLLSHSHAWKAAGATPTENVNRNLWKADTAIVNHPREMLDLLCVADLACWSSGRGTFFGPSPIPWHDELASLYGPADQRHLRIWVPESRARVLTGQPDRGLPSRASPPPCLGGSRASSNRRLLASCGALGLWSRPSAPVGSSQVYSAGVGEQVIDGPSG
jgi:hypothetical protein